MMSMPTFCMKLSEVLQKFGDVDCLPLGNMPIYNADKPNKAFLSINNAIFERGFLSRDREKRYTVLMIEEVDSNGS